MRRKIVAGNWKMNGSRANLAEYVHVLSSRLKDRSGDVNVVLAPPSVFIPELQTLLESSSVELSAQNVAAYKAGAYTGELGASMLKEYGCQWCLVGHSERRTLFAETDADIVAKTARLLEADIQPVLCVGETLEQREQGLETDLVSAQLKAVLSGFELSELSGLVVAYEPVWAIGTGKTATPEQAQEMHAYIRSVAAGFSSEFADALTILYGGSVNAGNAKALFAQQDIDGGLVGGASLKADEFSQICESMG